MPQSAGPIGLAEPMCDLHRQPNAGAGNRVQQEQAGVVNVLLVDFVDDL